MDGNIFHPITRELKMDILLDQGYELFIYPTEMEIPPLVPV
jgi:hypothetical protein